MESFNLNSAAWGYSPITYSVHNAIPAFGDWVRARGPYCDPTAPEHVTAFETLRQFVNLDALHHSLALLYVIDIQRPLLFGAITSWPHVTCAFELEVCFLYRWLSMEYMAACQQQPSAAVVSYLVVEAPEPTGCIF